MKRADAPKVVVHDDELPSCRTKSHLVELPTSVMLKMLSTRRVAEATTEGLAKYDAVEVHQP